jgi:DNA-binding Lrp family transcriptional regulator
MPNQDYEPDDNEEEQILQVLKDEGRANPLRIREQTDIRKEYVSRKLDNLVRAGWVRRVTRGLYEFVDDPRDTEDGDE